MLPKICSLSPCRASQWAPSWLHNRNGSFHHCQLQVERHCHWETQHWKWEALWLVGHTWWNRGFCGFDQVAFDSGLGDGRVLVECCQSESSKFMDMAPSECLLQGGEGCAEEGGMSKCHKVSGGGTTKGGIGMEQHSKTVA